MEAKNAAEEARNAAESETGRKLRALQRENLEGAAVQAGLDLKAYEATAKKRLGGLMDLSPRLLAEQHAADVHATSRPEGGLRVEVTLPA